MKTKRNSKQKESRVVIFLLALVSACLLIAAVDDIGNRPHFISVVFAFIGIACLFISGVIFLGYED